MSKSCQLKGRQKLFYLHLNKVASCCRADPVDIVDTSIEHYIDLWHHENRQLDQGIEIPSCRHCWKAEHQGQQSYRQRMAHVNTNYVEIVIDNLCNQMCSYCSPKFSSTWEDNIRQHGKFINISKSANENLTDMPTPADQDIWIEQISKHLSQGPTALKLLGGEPLMQRKNLQKLLDLNTENIETLCINTNLNPPSNKFLKWVLSAFPGEKLEFRISLDTIPEHNAIPRAGFDQQKFYQNLDLLKQHNIKFSFLSVVSVLNIFSIDLYQKWLTQNEYSASFFRINNPDCLDPVYLPLEFKKLILNDFLPVPAKQALEYQPDKIDLKQFEQYNYLKQYFQRTNTRITDTSLAGYLTWLEEKYK